MRSRAGGVEPVSIDPRWTLQRGLRVAVAGPLADRRVVVPDDLDARFEAHVAVYRTLLRSPGFDPGISVLDASGAVDKMFDDPTVWDGVLAVARELAIAGRVMRQDARRVLIDAIGPGSSHRVPD